MLKKFYIICILGAAVMAALALLLMYLQYQDNKADTQQEDMVELFLETGSDSYELQVYNNRVLIRKAGEDAVRSWKPEGGRRIVDAMVARRKEGVSEELLVIVGPKGSAYGSGFEILAVDKDGKLRSRASETMNGMNPWKLKTADVDGDGIQDISITMYKKTQFHPVMANRPFLYFWKEDRIEPLWRGSRLSRPFDDYVFFDLNGDGRDELVAVEELETGERILQAYCWKGFGFEGLAQSGAYDEMAGLHVNEEAGVVEIKAESPGPMAPYTVIYKDEKLQLMEEE